MAEIVGGVLMGVTIKLNVRVKVAPLLFLAVTLIVPSPFTLAAGVMVRDLIAPEPPSTRFAFGTSDVFAETAVTVMLAAAVVWSPTTNCTVTELFSSTVTFWFASPIGLMVGSPGETSNRIVADLG